MIVIGLIQVHNQMQMFTFKVAYQANHIAPYTSCYINTGGSAGIQKSPTVLVIIYDQQGKQKNSIFFR